MALALELGHGGEEVGFEEAGEGAGGKVVGAGALEVLDGEDCFGAESAAAVELAAVATAAAAAGYVGGWGYQGCEVWAGE